MRDFYYRKHIKVTRNFIVISIGLLASLFWIIALTSNFVFNDFQFFLIFMAVLMTVETIFIWIFMGRFNKIKISADNTKLIYKNYKGEIILPFEDIEKIQISSMKYLGGWMKIISKDKTIRITVVVKDIGELLLIIKKGLDSHGQSHLYKEKNFTKFLRTAVYSDESWDRLYALWWKLILFSILLILFAVIIGSFIQTELLFIIIVISTFYPITVYVITELFFMKWISKLIGENIDTIPKRDIYYEDQVYKYTMIFSPGVYILIIALVILL